jgi:CRISPR system Cascade subunit CasE
MYLSRLSLNRSRLALQWVGNPYRVHQRLKMGCEGDPRLLFRIEENEAGTMILAQTQLRPVWGAAFDDFKVLAGPPEVKSFELVLQAGRAYRFRLLANPTVKKTVEAEGEERRKTRLGLINEAEQVGWLERKLEAAGAEIVSVQVRSLGLVQSRKNPAKDEQGQTHLGVVFEGVLLAKEAEKLEEAVRVGIGPAKGYGFGLLSLAAVRGD